jgi:GR25 family glycosyltransferase involved in LPS biosynthesis
MNAIPTFVINLDKRTDRKRSVLREFRNKPEFDVNIVSAQQSKCGALGLWKTMRSIIESALGNDLDYVIICEDDHKFTNNYTKEILINAISNAVLHGADLLFGSVSWFSNSIPLRDGLFWLEDFSGTQFFVVFKKFYRLMLTNNDESEAPADARMSELTIHKMAVFPFLSVQKEFGYSDATDLNNEIGRVKNLFKWASRGFKTIQDVDSFYSKHQVAGPDYVAQADLSTICIPTYAINLPGRSERLAHIKAEFEGKPEFDLTIVEATEHQVGALGLWMSIRRVIQMAIDSDDDVIIICEDDHQFTDHYSPDYLLSNILHAHRDGAYYLSGGTGQFGFALPLTENRYWVNHCLSTQFVVIFKKMFKKILSEPFDEEIIADIAYSQMTSNKMVLFPFVSTQKNFGYSDVTPMHHQDKDLIDRLFNNSISRLQTIQRAYRKFRLKTEKVA